LGCRGSEEFDMTWSNQPAAGKAGITSRLTISHYWPGVPALAVSRMRRAIFIVCGAYAIVSALFAFRETAFLQLLFGVLLFGLFVSCILSAVHAFRSWRELRWRALLPFCLCGIVFVVSTDVGRLARDAYFRHQIPRLEVAVKTFHTSGQLPEVSWRGYQVTTSKIGATNAAVIFWWGGGFPVKHTVLVYCSADDPTVFFRDGGWRRGHALADHWWVAKD
jgi:hypothetical protein